ncbi:hypothetical protein [Mesobacillus zeae]|uniref:Flagellar hook-length control protein FliK n=1 Tax=Mesobacillus zeae TaxID=1917180 RepID=A0A398BH54_9BACI|nr:hypothetical protein [Mesobacillus zeae]RID87978.1 hypothetical protein D1970_03855 [Mesobacillus zeae]
MDTNGAIGTILKQLIPESANQYSFRPGQVINAKVIRLFPDNTAEIQIGGQKLIAQLEAPLSAGQRYWFQVQPGEGKIHLRIMFPDEGGGQMSGNLSKVLMELLMPPGKESEELVRGFIRNKLPMTSETMQLALTVAKEGKSAAGNDMYDVLKLIFSNNLPFTRQVYSSLYAALKGEPFSILAERLQTALQAEPALKGAKSFIQWTAPEPGRESNEALTTKWLSGTNLDSDEAFEVMQQRGNIKQGESEAKFLERIWLKGFGNELSTVGPQPLLDGFRRFEEVVRLLQAGDLPGALALTDRMGKAAQTSAQITVGDLLPLLKNAGAGDVPQFDKPVTMHAVKKLMNLVLSDNKDFDSLFGLVAASEGIPEAQAAAKAIRESITRLGLSYEHDTTAGLKQNGNVGDELRETLKPQLIQLLSGNLPQAVRETAESLLGKITGFQLLSQETGPLQQLAVQIPFPFPGKSTDVTMQWSGRKTNEGKIDPDYCRVLFYLDLEHLGYMMVDMQVQNRIMGLVIINENEAVKEMASPLLGQLKKKLSAIEYHLSSVTFTKPSAQKDKEPSGHASMGPAGYSGVDIKI